MQVVFTERTITESVEAIADHAIKRMELSEKQRSDRREESKRLSRNRRRTFNQKVHLAMSASFQLRSVPGEGQTEHRTGEWIEDVHSRRETHWTKLWNIFWIRYLKSQFTVCFNVTGHR